MRDRREEEIPRGRLAQHENAPLRVPAQKTAHAHVVLTFVRNTEWKSEASYHNMNETTPYSKIHS